MNPAEPCNLIELYRFQSSLMSSAAIRAVEDITPGEIERVIDIELTKRGLERFSVEKTPFSTDIIYTSLPNKSARCIILNNPSPIENNVRLALIYLDNMPGICEEIQQSFYIPGIVPLAMPDEKKERWGRLRWEMDRKAKGSPRT